MSSASFSVSASSSSSSSSFSAADAIPIETKAAEETTIEEYEEKMKTSIRSNREVLLNSLLADNADDTDFKHIVHGLRSIPPHIVRRVIGLINVQLKK
jgi:hypothetical protein